MPLRSRGSGHTGGAGVIVETETTILAGDSLRSVAEGSGSCRWQLFHRWSYSGSGRPLVSGAKGSAASPIRNTKLIVTPAYRMGSAWLPNTLLVR